MKQIFAFLLLCSWAYAEDSRVIDVRRNIALSDDDKVFKDFYIYGGTEVGYKKGQVLTALRKINVHDAAGLGNAIGEIKVPVGELRVIAVYDKVTVARLVKLLERDELPMLEQRAVMTGDLIEVKK
jgi:hypothetical protein